MDEWLNSVLTEEAKLNKDFVPNSGEALITASRLEQFEKENTQPELTAV